MRYRALLLDLDDTLYDYDPANRRGIAAVRERVVVDIGVSADEFDERYATARAVAKGRLPKSAASHSRLVYLAELAHDLGRGLSSISGWHDVYWTAFLDGAQLRDGATESIDRFREQGGKVAIVTDLTLDVQLRKLAHFDLIERVDALVTSEEVPLDKPDRGPFQLALARLGVDAKDAIMVGDSQSKDGGGAAAIGVAFKQVRKSGEATPALREVLDAILDGSA